jgi:hypothetical protein
VQLESALTLGSIQKEENKKPQAEIERLTIELWQAKGALGYSVPGNIPCGNFVCGLCEAKAIENQKLRLALEIALDGLETLKIYTNRCTQADQMLEDYYTIQSEIAALVPKGE